MFKINITYSDCKRTGRQIGKINSRCHRIAEIRSVFVYLPRFVSDFVVRPYISFKDQTKDKDRLITGVPLTFTHVTLLLLLSGERNKRLVE